MVVAICTNAHYKSLGGAGGLLDRMRTCCRALNSDGNGFVICANKIKQACITSKFGQTSLQQRCLTKFGLSDIASVGRPSWPSNGRWCLTPRSPQSPARGVWGPASEDVWPICPPGTARAWNASRMLGPQGSDSSSECQLVRLVHVCLVQPEPHHPED